MGIRFISYMPWESNVYSFMEQRFRNDDDEGVYERFK